MTQDPESSGRVVRVHGSVLDVRFDDAELPALQKALLVPSEGAHLVLEVQQHLDRHAVRAVALQPPGFVVATAWGVRTSRCVSP